jgi:ferredoxin
LELARAVGYDKGMGKVYAIHIEPDKCVLHECCVYICPEVFEISPNDSTVRVKDSAESVFKSRASDIVLAVKSCPVQALWCECDQDVG